MVKKISFALIIFSVLLAACAASSRNLRSPELPVPAAATSVQNVESVGLRPAPAEKSAYALDQTVASVDRLVIKNA